MPGKAIKSTNKKGGKRLPGPHTGTKSSLNGTISSSLNKKVADKQKEKEKRAKESSKSSRKGEHDPDVSFFDIHRGSRTARSASVHGPLTGPCPARAVQLFGPWIPEHTCTSE